MTPVAAPRPTRDTYNAKSLGRGLNAHVKQVGTRRSIALSFTQLPTRLVIYSLLKALG